MGAALEQSAYASGGGPGIGSTADYLWTLLFGCFVLLGFGIWLGYLILGPSLLMFVIYLWSRKFPEAPASVRAGRSPSPRARAPPHRAARAAALPRSSGSSRCRARCCPGRWSG